MNHECHSSHRELVLWPLGFVAMAQREFYSVESVSNLFQTAGLLEPDGIASLLGRFRIRCWTTRICWPRNQKMQSSSSILCPASRSILLVLVDSIGIGAPPSASKNRQRTNWPPSTYSSRRGDLSIASAGGFLCRCLVPWLDCLTTGRNRRSIDLILTFQNLKSYLFISKM